MKYTKNKHIQEYTKQDLTDLLKMSDKEKIHNLHKTAQVIKEAHLGKKTDKIAVIKFSNYCERNCLFCEMRKSNDKLTRFRLKPEQIARLAQKAEKEGYKSVIFESGEDSQYSIDELVKIIKLVKTATKLSIGFNIGEKSPVEYSLMRNAGSEKYLLNHQTSDPILYRQLNPDLKYPERIKCIRVLKNLGYKVGSGVMVGLPGQTIESIANDIFFFKTFETEIASIVPYIPQTNTPLAGNFKRAGGYFIPAIGYFDIEEMILKIISITRLVNPKINIITSEELEEKALRCGADCKTQIFR